MEVSGQKVKGEGLTLSLYYFILYISAGYKEYIYYTLYLLSSSIFLAYCYGMASHYFHIYGEFALTLNSFAIVSPIFLALFIKSIFNTPENYTLENKFINSIIVIFSLTYLFDGGEQAFAEPALTVRFYHDANIVEVLTGHLQHGRQRYDHVSDSAIKIKWKLNRFLFKWLGYCLYLGHSFTESANAENHQQSAVKLLSDS